MEEIYEVFALKYADRNGRIRGDSFIFDDDHSSPHPMDYFIWVIRNGARTIVIDTGYDGAEATRRDRPILREPVEVLRDFGIDAGEVDTVIITHLHYDHAGTLDRFPNAVFHLQASEMAFATGPCMCHGALQMPYTAEHICDMVRKVYSGKVVFHDGDGSVAPGVEVAAIGGHSRGLQSVRVKTARGWLVLASDAAHFYENYLAGKPFPIVENLEAMYQGFERIQALASAPELVIPGHDPLVCQMFPLIGAQGGAAIHRLDVAPIGDFAAAVERFRAAD